MKKWIESLIGNWLLKKGIAKGTKAASSALVGLVAAALAKGSVQAWLTNLGVTIDPQQLEAGIALAVTGGTASLLNYLKVRFDLKFL